MPLINCLSDSLQGTNPLFFVQFVEHMLFQKVKVMLWQQVLPNAFRLPMGASDCPDICL